MRYFIPHEIENDYGSNHTELIFITSWGWLQKKIPGARCIESDDSDVPSILYFELLVHEKEWDSV